MRLWLNQSAGTETVCIIYVPVPQRFRYAICYCQPIEAPVMSPGTIGYNNQAKSANHPYTRMFRSLKTQLEAMLVVEEQSSEEDKARAANLAATALLIEAAQADQNFSDDELAIVEASLLNHMNISREDIHMTIELAKGKLDNSTCLYEITTVINDNWTLREKIRLIESLWRVVLSDRYLDSHEQHLMRKLQNLLYIPHSEYIAAKVRVKNTISDS